MLIFVANDNVLWLGRGVEAFKACKFQEALAYFDRSLALKECPYARWNRAS
jgi:hypothetical protein